MTSTWRKWISGLLVIAGLVVASCAGLFTWVWNNKKDVEPTAEAYLRLIEAQDYANAYRMLDAAWIAKEDQASFSRAQRILRNTMGPLKSKIFAGFDVFSADDGKKGVLAYTAQFAKGPATIQLIFSNSTGHWAVARHYIDSPLFVRVRTCPHCKHLQSDFSPYCAACGKPIPMLQLNGD